MGMVVAWADDRFGLPPVEPKAVKPRVPDRRGVSAPSPSILSAGVRLNRGATRQMPLRSRAISACATWGAISQAQNASRSISLAAVLSLPQADKETIFT